MSDEIVLPQQCGRHNRMTVRRPRIGPEGPWRAFLIVQGVLMFQWAASSDLVHKRTGNDAAVLSQILNELGCLSCAFPTGYKKSLTVLRKGLSHAAAVSQGKTHDPDWLDLRDTSTGG